MRVECGDAFGSGGDIDKGANVANKCAHGLLDSANKLNEGYHGAEGNRVNRETI